MGCTLWTTNWHELLAEKFPTYIKGKKIHQLNGVYLGKAGYPKVSFQSKYILFNPDMIDETGFDEGSHHANMTGKVVEMKDDEMYLLHINHVGWDYVMKKNEKNKRRLSDFDKQCRWGRHYYAKTETLRKSDLMKYPRRFKLN